MIPSLENYVSNSDNGDPIPSKPSEFPDSLTDDGKYIDRDSKYIDRDREYIDRDGEYIDRDRKYIDRDSKVIPLSTILPSRI